MNKTERQLISICKWIESDRIGTVNAVPRFGKTQLGIMAILESIKLKHGLVETIIIVPSKIIQDIWITVIANKNLNLCTKVYTINSLLNKVTELGIESFKNTELFILDELQRYTSDTRFTLLNKLIKHTPRLGLTGTYLGTTKMFDKVCPVIDSITEKEALTNNWITPYSEYNLGIELEDKYKAYYYELTSNITRITLAYKDVYKRFNTAFNSDFDFINALRYGKMIVKSFVRANVLRQIVAQKMGWSEELSLDNTYTQQIDKYWNPTNILELATLYDENVRERNELLNNYYHKENITVLLVGQLQDKKIIIFNKSINLAEKITASINQYFGNIAVCYHSKLTSRAMIDPTTGQYYKQKDGKDKIFGINKLRQLYVDGMKSGQFRVLVTVDTMNEGLDIPQLDVAIITAGNVNPIEQTQRTSRVKTINPDTVKDSIIINLFIDEFQYNGQFVPSRDKVKLMYRQKNSSEDIITCYTVSDLLTCIFN